MKVIFRTDSSFKIGSGHVMRCLTLASALQAQGASCRFICREHPGHLISHIREQGFEVTCLPAPDSANAPGPGHAMPFPTNWLGTRWEQDAADTCSVLQAVQPDWLIVDHYALQWQWETWLRESCGHLMVIDDLANRRHDCDLLLDQNLGRHPSDYAGLTLTGCRILAGSDYALLRPEFLEQRATSLQRRRQPKIGRLLITMGGIDTQNTTARVLGSLKCCPLPPDCHIMVVLGLHAPWLEQIRELAGQMPWTCEVLTNVQNMAQLMATSDLAIGAAGSTSWERCALGLPSLAVVLAENQHEAARHLEQAGATSMVMLEDLETHMQPALAMMLSTSTLSVQSRNAVSLVDGRGTDRVVQTLLEESGP